MTGKRVRISLVFLVTLLLVYITLQTFFIVKSYSLEKKHFEGVVRNLVGDTFYETNIDRGKLEDFANKFKSNRGWEKVDLGYLREQLKEALSDYNSLPERLEKKLRIEGIRAELQYRLSIKSFVLLDKDKPLYSIEEDGRVPEGIVLMNNIDSKISDLFATSFYLREWNNYTRIQFEVGFPGLVDYVLNKIRMLIIFSSVAVIIIFAILLFTAITMLRQEELSEMKSDFIDNITHELNTPIATIGMAVKNMGHSSVLDNQVKTAEIAEVIKRQNQKLQEMVGGIMRISFIKTGVELKKESADICKLIESTVKDFCFKNPSAVIEKHFEDNIPPVSVDRFLVSTALFNLLDNGYKYSGGVGSITICGGVENNCPVITVRDRGCGISRKDAKKIFKKFYRVSQGNLHDVKGLGVGLYTVKKIVDAHGGKIRLESQPGKGSCFTVLFKENGTDNV